MKEIIHIDHLRYFEYYCIMLEIVTLGDDILRKKCATVAVFDEKLRDFLEAMIVTMREGNGIGLAGPQVGVDKRFFVCQVPDQEPHIFINPELIGTSEDVIPYEEGCLSIPGIYSDIVRPAWVKVQAWNVRGKPFTMEADGILARVIQHEMDHLKGVLFIDHLNEKKRMRLIKTYEKRLKK